MKVLTRSVLVFSLLVLALFNATATAHAMGAWVLWAHSYEMWVDKNKENHRRDVTWKKVAATPAKSDCDARTLSEARAEYYTLIGRGMRVTLSGSEVGFDQINKRFKQGYRKFECWPDTEDPRGAKGK
jgi:hypothetical protein